MIRKAVLFACLSILAGCATPSSDAPAPSADKPAALAVDPRLCAPIPVEPSLPASATIPQPVTIEEKTATEAFLNWAAEVLDGFRVLQGRAEVAKASCPKA